VVAPAGNETENADGHDRHTKDCSLHNHSARSRSLATSAPDSNDAIPRLPGKLVPVVGRQAHDEGTVAPAGMLPAMKFTLQTPGETKTFSDPAGYRITDAG